MMHGAEWFRMPKLSLTLCLASFLPFLSPASPTRRSSAAQLRRPRRARRGLLRPELRFIADPERGESSARHGRTREKDRRRRRRARQRQKEKSFSRAAAEESRAIAEPEEGDRQRVGADGGEQGRGERTGRSVNEVSVRRHSLCIVRHIF
jgi:hypothetical protein